jgi:hypothetical protein
VRENLLWEHSFFIGIDGVILGVIFTILFDGIEFTKLILDNIYSVRVPPYPSTAYEGAQTLSTHPILMADAVSGGLQPQ